MPDQFTDVATKGFGQRILGSILGIPIGLILIIVSIGVLYWNEGRFDLSKLARQATEISATEQAPATSQGKIVAIKGSVTSPAKIGDTYIVPGDYLALKRTAEEYAWVEKSSSKTSDNTGGSQTTTTTYTYEKQWVDDVADSGTFNHPEGHTNTPKSIDSKDIRASTATVGKYSLDFATLALPGFAVLPLDTANAVPTTGYVLTGDGKLFKGTSYDMPTVGDMRIGYSSLSNNFQGTVIGKLNGTNIETFADAKNHKLYRLFVGGKQDAVTTLHTEYKFMLWIFRFGGFVAIFFGLIMLVGPLTTILSFFPTIGRIGGFVVGTIALPIALLISGVTILVGMIAHSPIALGVALSLTVFVSIFYIRHRAAKSAPATLPAPPVA